MKQYFENILGEVLVVTATTELLVKGDVVRTDSEDWDEEYMEENHMLDDCRADAYDPDVETLDLEDCLEHNLLKPTTITFITDDMFEKLLAVVNATSERPLNRYNLRVRLLRKHIAILD